MWFFMISCYLFTLLTFVLLFLTALMGYFHFSILNANHPAFALLTIIVYLFTETLVIFFFVGTGVSVKEFTQEQKLDNGFHKRSIEIKRQVYPPLMLNMFLVMTLFITGGAVDTHRLPGWLHGALFLICIVHFVKAVGVQHQCFKKNTALILEMSGLSASSAGK